MRILILMLLCQCASAQGFFPKVILLKVHEDSLTCTAPCSSVTVTLTFSNDSAEDVLVYGLKKGGPRPTSNLTGLCDVKRTGTGIAFAVFGTDGTQKIPRFEIGDPLKQKKVTKEMVDSTILTMNTHFLESARILKKQEEITMIRQLPLKDFNLPKGLYHVQVVYYCGLKTVEMLDRNKVLRSAELFQGCTTSAKIPLTVN